MVTIFEDLGHKSFASTPILIKEHSGSLVSLKEEISKNGNFNAKKKLILDYILPSDLVDNESNITEKDKVIIANMIFYYNDLNEAESLFGRDYPYFLHVKYIGNSSQKTEENLNELYALQDKMDFNVYNHSVRRAKSFYRDIIIRYRDNKVGVFLTRGSSKTVF